MNPDLHSSTLDDVVSQHGTGPSQVTAENVAYSLIILFITLLLLITSLLTICVILTSNMKYEIVGLYLMSLAVSDLFCATMVAPFSIYAALDERWRFENVPVLCKLEGYLEIVLWASTVYIFMWIGVDRYAALNKPARYEIEQTLTRCKCWIIFTWIASILLCCPTLFFEDRKHAKYDEDTFLCHMNWKAMAPYSVTMGVLVVVPSSISVFHSYSYIFRHLKDPRSLEDNQKLLLENDTSYVVTSFVVMTFVVSWTPYFILRIYETAFGYDIDSRCLQFTFMWLAIGGGNWKFFIYCSINEDFRNALRNICKNMCTNSRVDDDDSSQYIRLVDRRRSCM